MSRSSGAVGWDKPRVMSSQLILLATLVLAVTDGVGTRKLSLFCIDLMSRPSNTTKKRKKTKCWYTRFAGLH